jgi:hypothetical protein
MLSLLTVTQRTLVKKDTTSADAPEVLKALKVKA